MTIIKTRYITTQSGLHPDIIFIWDTHTDESHKHTVGEFIHGHKQYDPKTSEYPDYVRKAVLFFLTRGKNHE